MCDILSFFEAIRQCYRIPLSIWNRNDPATQHTLLFYRGPRDGEHIPLPMLQGQEDWPDRGGVYRPVRTGLMLWIPEAEED